VCPTPWTLERTLVVGSAGGPVDFTNIIDMEVGRDGKIYVTQSFSPSVTVLTAQGRPDRQLGRVGQGPGEFAMMAIKVGMVGDSLWATDMEGVEVFAPNLRPAYSVNFRTAVASEESAFLPEIPLPDGTFLGNRQVNGSAWEQIDRFPLLRFSRTGAVVDTITMVARPSDRFFVEVPDVVRPGRTALLDNPLYEWSDVSWLPVVVTADRTAVLLLGDVRINDERSLLNPLGRPRHAVQAIDSVRPQTGHARGAGVAARRVRGSTCGRRRRQLEAQPVRDGQPDHPGAEAQGRS
jgi:hypothetical protein